MVYAVNKITAKTELNKANLTIQTGFLGYMKTKGFLNFCLTDKIKVIHIKG